MLNAESCDYKKKKKKINQHNRVLLFLKACSDKVRDKLCKRCKIDLEDPSTTIGVWSDLQKEALTVSTNDDS